MKLVTVGIPTYNRPEGLDVTLKRICGQSYANLEILVSDNASPREAEVFAVVSKWQKKDARIRFVRQQENIGVIRNFKFLLDQAQGEYFMWAADDDELDSTFVEKLMKALNEENAAFLPNVMAICGYDVTDRISNAFVAKDFTTPLVELQGADVYSQLKNYVQQPEYLGKARILWGLIRAQELKKSFQFCLQPVAHLPDLTFAELPIEVHLLTQGRLKVVKENLFHVYLLPSSTGLQEGRMFDRREIEMCRRSFAALKRVLMSAPLTPSQQRALLRIVGRQEAWSVARVSVFYFLQRRMPRLARLIKFLWFKVF